MKRGRPKLIKTIDEKIEIIKQEEIDPIIQKEQDLVRKIRSGASIYTQEELNIANQMYIRVGKEGSMCITCPASVARAFEVILHHYN